jgi:hypothetical protein
VISKLTLRYVIQFVLLPKTKSAGRSSQNRRQQHFGKPGSTSLPMTHCLCLKACWQIGIVLPHWIWVPPSPVSVVPPSNLPANSARLGTWTFPVCDTGSYNWNSQYAGANALATPLLPCCCGKPNPTFFPLHLTSAPPPPPHRSQADPTHPQVLPAKTQKTSSMPRASWANKPIS